MLGETRQNNDVYIFFENDEIERLEYEKIQGTYFNFRNPSKACSLEASVGDEIREKIKTSGERNEEGFFMNGFYVQIDQRKYQILKERRTGGTHEGVRHIELLDANNLDIRDKFAYRQLKHYESQHLQQKA